MYNRVYSYLEKFTLFHPKQYGFRSEHSTIDALAELTENMRLQLSDENYCFFLDLKKKAFDTIDHDIPIRKTWPGKQLPKLVQMLSLQPNTACRS